MSHIALTLPKVCKFSFIQRIEINFSYIVIQFIVSKILMKVIMAFLFLFSLRQTHINIVLYAFYGEMVLTIKANIWVQLPSPSRMRRKFYSDELPE